MVKRAVLFVNGDLTLQPALKIKPGDFLIAVDGGIKLMRRLGLQPDLSIGDFDSSIRPKTNYLVKKTQELTDTEFALKYCQKQGFSEVVLTGAMGRRLDHLLANVFLAARFNLTIISGRQTLRFITGPAKIVFAGCAGDLVSLIPLTDCRGVTTFGLKWRLQGEALKVGSSRGVSNVMIGKKARVSLGSGRLLVVYNLS